VVGGQWTHNGGACGLAIGAFPAKRVPAVVDRLTRLWMRERAPDESLQDYIQRAGRAALRKELDDLREVPAYEVDPSFYVDWGDAREYTIGDMGVGECAGEVVSLAQFGLADSERQVFEAQLSLEQGDSGRAAELAYRAMLEAARALVREQNIDVADDAEVVVGEFRSRFHDTGLFHDPFAGAKFAQFLFQLHAEPPARSSGVDHERAHRTIEEAQLFIEAAHACYDRLQQSV
jgi:sulfite reductase (ferredoxin)